MRAKQEALTRKEIIEKMEKWMLACEEEGWLEDYNKVCYKSAQICLSPKTNGIYRLHTLFKEVGCSLGLHLVIPK